MASIYVTADTNLSALSYADGDFIWVQAPVTLTINSSNSVSPRQIITNVPGGEILVENTSTTTPFILTIGQSSASNSSVLESRSGSNVNIRGGKIVLGTGTGVAGQTFNLPTTDTGANCPVLAGLWSEQIDTLRDGTAVPRLHRQVDATAYANLPTHERIANVFTQDTTANTVTFLNAIPAGVEVYMANIIVEKNTTSTYSLPGFLDAATGGNIDARYAHFLDFYLTTGDCGSLAFDHVSMDSKSTTGPWNFNRCGTVPTMKNCIGGARIGSTNQCTILYVTNSAALDFRNCWFDGNSRGSTYPCRLNSCQDIYGERVVLTNYGDNGAVNSRYAVWLIGFRMKLYDFWVGYPSTIAAITTQCTDIEIDNWEYAMGCRTDLVETYSPNAILIQQSFRISITNFNQIDPAVYGNQFRQGNSWMNSSNGSEDIYISDCVVHSGATGTGTDRYSVLLQVGMDKSVFENITTHGQFTARILNQNRGQYNEFRNIYHTDAQTDTNNRIIPGVGWVIDRVSDGSNRASPGIDSHNLPQTMRDFQSYLIYVDGDTNRTQGHLGIAMVDSPTDPHIEYVGEGTAALEFNNTGLLYVRQPTTVPIRVTSATYKGITGCTAWQWHKSGLSNTTYFAVRRTNGAWSTTAAVSVANIDAAIAALPASSDNDVQFRFEYTVTTTSDSQYLSKIEMDLDLDGRTAETVGRQFEEDSPWNDRLENHTTPGTFGAFVQSLGGTDNAAIAAAVWAAATSANNVNGSFGRMTQQTHLSATRAGSLYQEEEE
jgi:hypothetical protein